MPSDELKQHATSEHDFYDLLGVQFESSEAEIRRAYRRTALKYHPDKNADNPSAVEKFHILQIAYDVLSDPAVKALYDNARAARLQKLRQAEMFEGKRRQMKEDLERRESGAFKRKRDEETAEEQLEREIRRLAEDGKRRRREREEMLNKDKLEEEDRLDRERNSRQEAKTTPDFMPEGGTNVPEIDRTVKVRWLREGKGIAIDKDRLSALFSRFGDIENTLLLKDKKRRVGETGKKKIMATGIIVYSSIVGAHAAVEDARKQIGEDWDVLESVIWAAEKEIDLGQSIGPKSPASEMPSMPTTPSSTTKMGGRTMFPGLDSAPTTPLSSFKAKANGEGLRKVPSFASFTSLNTPLGSPFGKANPQSPSLEEITMIRLKNAEKKRLEEQIRRDEAAAEAAENDA